MKMCESLPWNPWVPQNDTNFTTNSLSYLLDSPLPLFCPLFLLLHPNFFPKLIRNGRKYRLKIIWRHLHAFVNMFHAPRGGRWIDPRCPWRAWKCSTLPVEGVEVFHTAHGGHGSIPRCPWRAWKCSTLPMEGVETFHAAHGGRRSVPRCPWRALTYSTLPVEGVEVF